MTIGYVTDFQKENLRKTVHDFFRLLESLPPFLGQSKVLTSIAT